MLPWLLAGWALAGSPIADAVATGDCREVARLLPEPKTDDERLAVGWCLEHTGKDADAAKLLESVTAEVVGDYARLVRARALLDAGDPATAATVLENLVLPGAPGKEVALTRARAQVLAKESPKARDALRKLLDGDTHDEALHWLAVGALDRGEKDAAIAAWTENWQKSTRGPWGDLAKAQLAALGVAVPTYDTADGRTIALARFRALAKANRHEDALVLLVGVRSHDVADTPAERLQWARAHFNARKHAEASAAFEVALGKGAEAVGEPQDLFDDALAHTRAGDYDGAVVLYRRLIALHPTAKEADFASFKLGYLEFDRSRLKDAIARFDEYVAARPDGAHVDEALWFEARAAWRLDRREEAVKAWDRLLTTRPKSSLAPGAAYWKGRAADFAGDSAAAKAAYEDVLRRWPVSGYAWFSAHRLQRRFPAKPLATAPNWPASLSARRDVQRGTKLLSLGFHDWARAELASVREPAADAGRDGALAAAWAFEAADDWDTGKALAQPYCVSPWKDGDAVAQQACTPRAVGSVVAGVAARYKLDPWVPFGIMTAESALDPDVTSLAGARGLMQIMPVEGERMHKALYGADRPYDPDHLYAAPYNASLGTCELGMKQASLKGLMKDTDLPAVIASYNGGEEAVRRWTPASEPAPDADAWTEDIGYTETRQYVKRVLGFVMAYRYVYGDPP